MPYTPVALKDGIAFFNKVVVADFFTLLAYCFIIFCTL